VRKRETELHSEQSGIRITSRLKEIKKRRALRGKQRVELLINSLGKRTVVVLNPSFFYFFNPFFVMRNPCAPNNRHSDFKQFSKMSKDNELLFLFT
jgi:hypothetical protein